MWKQITIFIIVATLLLIVGWFLYPTLLGSNATPAPIATATLTSLEQTGQVVTAQPSEIPIQAPTNTQIIQPTLTFVPSPVPPTAVPQRDLAISAADIQLFPAPQIYAGERVTFQIAPRVPDFLQVEDVVVDVLVDGQSVGRQTLTRQNFSAGRWAVRAA